MNQTKHLHPEEEFGESELLERMHEKIDEIDWELAKSAIAMFIPNKQRLAIWSTSFFHDLIGHLRVVDDMK
jgi:hypothetical protein